MPAAAEQDLRARISQLSAAIDVMITALPDMRQRNPQFCELLGWARDGDRAALRGRAFDAAQRLPASLPAFLTTGEPVGEILLAESVNLKQVVDWLARTEPPPAGPPPIRERIDAVIQRARAGDGDAILYEKALAAPTDAECLQLLEQSAMLGSVDAMEAAMEMSAATGNAQAAVFWAESAAHAGSVKGMHQLAYDCSGAGREAEAMSWLERAGQAGDPTAYEFLSDLASQRGDDQAGERWAELGAALGSAECLRRKGSYVAGTPVPGGAGSPEWFMQAAKAYVWFVEAARRGNDQAMIQAAAASSLFGHHGQAAYWYTRAAALGNAEAQQRLSEGVQASAAGLP